MSTYMSQVADLFLSRMKNDYTLQNIYNTNGSTIFNQVIEPFLLDAIEEFDVCDQDLTYIVSGISSEGYFVQDLKTSNLVMLSRIMILPWLAKDIQNTIALNNMTNNDRGFKTFSPAQNTKSKQDLYSSRREEISQLLQNYALRRVDWQSWYNQDFL